MIGRLVDRLIRLALAITGILVALDVLRSPAEPLDTTPPARETSTVKRWALTAAALLVLAGMAGCVVVVSGIVPINASSGHWPITVWFMEFAMRRSTATYSLGIRVPPLDEAGLVLKGAGQYHIACRPCHGSPGLDQPVIARQMTPRPPDLRVEVPEYKAQQLFYVVKHGIKLTGMPAWPAQRRDDEVWAMVAFLRRLPELDTAAYERLATGRTSAEDDGAPIEDLLVPERVPRAISESCSRCHGLTGLGRGEGAFPRLAGQRPAYLLTTMQAYANGDRHSGIMEPIAAALDVEQMQEIASYYASLDSRAPAAGEEHASSEVDLGAAIATRGLPDQLVPPCVSCHGPGGEHRRNPHYPRLAGQYADYIRLQLSLFKSDSRGGTAYSHVMRKVAGQLTDQQMRAVARYFSSVR